MRDTIDMAREAGLEQDGDNFFSPMHDEMDVHIADLKRFEALVRADEAAKYTWDVHSCGPTCTKAACVAMREAVEAEREACAKVCDELAGILACHNDKDGSEICVSLRDTIRTRGTHD